MRAPRPMLALLLVALAAALLAGCGGSSTKDERQPDACREGVATYLDALRAAPGEVILAGETPISGCLVPAAEEGEVADLGEDALAAATKLNSQARAEPGGPGALQLGYLIGAIARGTAGSAGGLHAELLRLLTVAARFAPEGHPLSPRFLTAYEKGFAASRALG